jgi:hypothetical protein
MNQLFVFAQNNAIHNFTNPPKYIGYIDCVKNITIYNNFFHRHDETVDTVTSMNKIQFNKKGIISTQWAYNTSTKELQLKIECDNTEK